MANVTVRVACDEMLIVEDHQMKEQKNNSREVHVSSQQEIDVYNPSAREKEYIRQEKGVKPKGGGQFQLVGGTI